MAESPTHRELKTMVSQWIVTRGFHISAPEVRIPNSGFIADVAGYRSERRKHRDVGETALFEVKVSRQDFLKDAGDLIWARSSLKVLHQRKNHLEQLLKFHAPHLSQGDELFREYCGLQGDSTQHLTYTSVVKEIGRQERVQEVRSKFDRVAAYQTANLLYLVTLPKIMKPKERPLGWGWIEWTGDDFILRRQPVFKHIRSSFRLQLLENIARKSK